MKKNLFFAASTILLLAACNNNDEALTAFNDDNPHVSNEFAISNDEAKEVLTLFVNNGAETRSDGKSVTVKDYKVRNIEVTTGDDTEIVPVYEYTTMNENGEEGYSIVIGDRRIQKVLVQVDKGSLADTINIPPLKWFVRSIPHIIRSNIQEYKKNQEEVVSTRSLYDSYESIGPLLTTTWGQGYPYNKQTPLACDTAYNYTSNNGHCSAGCVPVAIGQLLAYYNKPSTLSWPQILSSPYITSNSSQTVINQVSNLLYNIGTTISVNYNPNRPTSSRVPGSYYEFPYSSVIPGCISSYTITYYGFHVFNLQTVIMNIQANKPVYLSAETSSYPIGGHDWICDGWKRHTHATNDYYDYLYMNWGWNGYSNGYFYIDPYNMSFYADTDFTLNNNFLMSTHI